MNYFKKINDILYKTNYIDRDLEKTINIWKKVRDNRNLLEWAINLSKDKFGQRDIVNGLSICENILMDYDNVDKDIYDRLITLIYSNKEIARIVIDGACNGGYSFLLMSLWNHGIQLTDEQKRFAENEAMFKIGTRFFNERKETFSRKLDKMGVSDDTTTMIDIDGVKTPVGCKSEVQYMNFIFSSLSEEQAHGLGPYDIRYQLLKNPNWTIEEKQKLIYDFWESNEEYDEFLEQWEWGIINEISNELACKSLIEKDYLYYYNYNDLLNILGNQLIVKRVWNDIQFCRLMHQIRPQQWEIISDNSRRLEMK